MTIRNPTGFCPKCNMQVLLIREEINWPLVIVLLIFTGGIGLIIYFIIYYNNPENTCIHCRSKVLNPIAQEARKPQQNPYQSRTEEKSSPSNYCPYCGEYLSNEKEKFCSNCGSSL